MTKARDSNAPSPSSANHKSALHRLLPLCQETPLYWLLFPRARAMLVQGSISVALLAACGGTASLLPRALAESAFAKRTPQLDASGVY